MLVDHTLFRPAGHRPWASHQFGTENHEKYTAECTLIDRLMIPLYQANAHDNPVRKDVRGLAVMGMFLGLLHEFGLDLLSPADLFPALAKGGLGRDQQVILLASGEDILSSHRPGPCTDLERPPARNTTGQTMSDTAGNLVW